MHPVSAEEVEALARGSGVLVERVVRMPDRMGRPGVSWTGVALRLTAPPASRGRPASVDWRPPSGWPNRQ